MLYTLFQRVSAYFSQTDTDAPSFSKEVDVFGESITSNALYTRMDTFELDATDTRAVTLANYELTEWVSVVAHVYGEAKVTTTAKDTNGTTDISGAMVGYGTKHHPGIIMLSTYNVSAFEFEGLADGTKVVLWVSVLAEDDDARLVSNA